MNVPGANLKEGTTPLRDFLRGLMDDGKAVVALQLPEDTPESLAPLLVELEARARAEIGLAPPPFRLDAAVWAARLLYQLCVFSVCRDISAERIAETCRQPCPGPRDPSAAWSADLLLRHLPTLGRFASHLNPADPLVREIHLLAGAWPLSSVGLQRPPIAPGDVRPSLDLDWMLNHPALRRLYADRIAATQDYSRLGPPTVDDQLRSDLGLHPELATGLAARLGSRVTTGLTGGTGPTAPAPNHPRPHP